MDLTIAETKRARLLEADPELGSLLDPDQLRRLRPTLTVAVRSLDGGEWRPSREPHPAGHLGFLVLRGSMTHETALGGGRGLELLGAGDLLRPWQEDAASFAEARWRVLEPVLLAELEPRVAGLIGRFPPLVEALVARTMERCRRLATYTAIESLASLEDRLVALFWQLAERRGRRSADGTVVPIRLTHRILAELIGARRPSVTVALGRLAAEGRLLRTGSAEWLLLGQPPEVDPAPLSRAGRGPRRSGSA